MLVFIVPLQSPQVSKDWPLVSKLAIRTLDSILQQISEDFCVLLICNQPPLMLNDHPKLGIIKKDFDIPENNTKSRMNDKWIKARTGVIYAEKFAPCHIMVVDADDCVSSKLSGYVSKNGNENGWYFDKGYMHDEGSRLVYKKRTQFSKMCGTSSIVKIDTCDFSSIENHPVMYCGHSNIIEEMEKIGRPLLPLPFIGTVYNLATGENDSNFSLVNWRSKKVFISKMFNYRPLTRRICNEFGVYNIY